jgi:hypothetical protein
MGKGVRSGIEMTAKVIELGSELSGGGRWGAGDVPLDFLTESSLGFLNAG